MLFLIVAAFWNDSLLEWWARYQKCKNCFAKCVDFL